MFQSIRSLRPRRNKFDLSHERKFSCNMGDLVPILVEEIVPGDKFRVSSEIMMRLAPMLFPVMHRVDVWVHFFFVPNRLIWNEWEDFITGGEDGQQEPVHPYFPTNVIYQDMVKGKLADYFGLPILDGQPAVNVNISSLPFRAYQTIYNEYYRDQNLMPKVPISKNSGEDTGYSVLNLQRRCWEKDYFTSALPFAQKGDSIQIPGTPNYSEQTGLWVGAPGQTPAGQDLDILTGDTLTPEGGRQMIAGTSQQLRVENLTDIGIDINDLRTSNALQRWLELAARGGSRYIEVIKNIFGVISSDARLQRPEYLGGGKQNVVISEVLQTSGTEEGGTTSTPLGEMAGHGVSVGSTNRFARSFEEHGFVMGIMSVLPRTAYQNGVDRFWRRSDKFDYYFPQFAHLGEQEIKNSEIYYDGDANVDDTWGYQARFAEYKHRRSMVAGDFRDNLNFAHMGRIFTDLPPLNNLFVQSNPTHRIFANTSETDHKLWVQLFNRVSALRPMPYYGTPRL